jgi:hypothetical protein
MAAPSDILDIVGDDELDRLGNVPPTEIDHLGASEEDTDHAGKQASHVEERHRHETRQLLGRWGMRRKRHGDGSTGAKSGAHECYVSAGRGGSVSRTDSRRQDMLHSLALGDEDPLGERRGT